MKLAAIFEAERKIGALPDNAGRDNPASRAIGQTMKRGREDVLTFLNGSKGTLLSEQSTTASAFRILEAAARGIRGTNIVCSELDHAAFYAAATILAERHGLERRVVRLHRPTGGLCPDSFASLVDAGTVAVTVIHASNITGAKTDLKAIARIVAERAPQAMIVADGAQHAQHSLIDVDDYGVDAYLFSAYKVFSKAGMAFAYLSPRLAALPHAQLVGKPAADWDLGTRDASGFAAFSTVVDYLCWLADAIGRPVTEEGRRARVAAAMRMIESYEAALSKRLLHGTGDLTGLLDHPRVTLQGTKNPGTDREAVFAFNVSGISAIAMVGEFVRRGVIVHHRIGDAYSRHTLEALGVSEVVRVSLAHYNTPQEVDAFLQALAEILEKT